MKRIIKEQKEIINILLNRFTKNEAISYIKGIIDILDKVSDIETNYFRSLIDNNYTKANVEYKKWLNIKKVMKNE